MYQENASVAGGKGMKYTIIKQLIKLERMLKMNGYEVLPRVKGTSLIIIIPLKGDNDKDIMSQWAK